MKQLFLMMLLTFVSGCANAVNQTAICDGSASARTAHAAALAQDGGNLSVVTGAKLIKMLDAACLKP